MSDRIIRKAEPGDIPGILHLLEQVDMVHHTGRPDLFKGPATKYSAEELKTILSQENTPVFICTDDSRKVLGHAFCIHRQIIGDSVLTDVRTLYIDDICVDKSSRRLGIGLMLYRHILDYAKSNYFYNITLNVWSCNPGAQAFYESLGLKPQKVTMEQLL